jgi:hypothetical protein
MSANLMVSAFSLGIKPTSLLLSVGIKVFYIGDVDPQISLSKKQSGPNLTVNLNLQHGLVAGFTTDAKSCVLLDDYADGINLLTQRDGLHPSDAAAKISTFLNAWRNVESVWALNLLDTIPKIDNLLAYASLAPLTERYNLGIFKDVSSHAAPDAIQGLTSPHTNDHLQKLISLV